MGGLIKLMVHLLSGTLCCLVIPPRSVVRLSLCSFPDSTLRSISSAPASQPPNRMNPCFVATTAAGENQFPKQNHLCYAGPLGLKDDCVVSSVLCYPDRIPYPDDPGRFYGVITNAENTHGGRMSCDSSSESKMLPDKQHLPHLCRLGSRYTVESDLAVKRTHQCL